MSFTTSISRNSVSFSNVSKNSVTFTLYLKHGKAPTMAELASYTFNSVVFADGTVMKNVTFADLVAQSWTLVSKS